MMVDEKNWYESTTIWGALIAVLASLASSFGLLIDAPVQTELAESLVQLVGAMGAILAIYGRLNATSIIQ